MAVLLLRHVPPVVVSDNVSVAPAHTEVPPVMLPATGREFTVTTVTATVVPQVLVTA